MKFLKSFSIITLAAMVMACSDEFLEKEIFGRSEVDDFYKTDKDAFQATLAIYDMLQASQQTDLGWTSPYLMKCVLSDEANAGSTPGDQPPIQNLDDYTFDSQNTVIRNAWSTAYFGIYRANLVINRVDPSNAYRQRLIAEARALRAYYYFELVTLFGDVPIVLTELMPSDYTTQERASTGAVYDLLESDLRQAIAVLPEKSELDMEFRLTKGAALTMLGKAYLYQENMDSAAFFLDQVIASGQYSLESNFSHILSKEGEFGVETVFSVPYSSDMRYGTQPPPRGRESNNHIMLMGPNQQFFTAAPGDSLEGGWGFNLPTRKLYDVFINAGDLVRRKTTLMSVEELKAAGGNWSNPDAHDFEGIIRRKYGTFSTETTTEGGANRMTNYGTDWRLIRYADVLLLAAEAHWRSNETLARQYINEVRDRAKLPHVTATGQDLFEAIVTERQLELALEGHRYQDLIRWKRAAQEIEGFQAGKHDLLPIPDNDVNAGNLTQNPGY